MLKSCVAHIIRIKQLCYCVYGMTPFIGIKTCVFALCCVFILWLFMARGKGFHTLLFPRGQTICAGHAAAVIRWARLCLSVIVQTVSLIRPLVPWLAAVPSNTIAHLIISITQPPYFSVEGFGSHSQAVRDHEPLRPFVHHNICTLAACDKVWR